MWRRAPRPPPRGLPRGPGLRRGPPDGELLRDHLGGLPLRERGRAFGLNAVVWGLGSILGIVLGGFLITFTSWRFIFLINVPVGIFGTWWAYATLREVGPSGKEESFDLPAAVLFTLGILSLLFGVTWGLLASWTDVATLASFALTPVFLAGFAVWELRFSRQPIVDFSLFRNRVFTFSVATGALQSLALFSVNFLLVFYLEGIAGLDILTASYLIVPMPVTIAVVGPFGGVLSDRFGARVIASIGLVVQAVALLLLVGLTTSTQILEVGVIEAIYGLGGGLFWPANTSAIMSSSPPSRFGVASGVMNTFRNTGMVMSFALSLVAATSAIPARFVYQLFIGDLTDRLSSDLAASYLAGQAFAFEVSAALLFLATSFSLVRGRLPIHGPAAAPATDRVPPVRNGRP